MVKLVVILFAVLGSWTLTPVWYPPMGHAALVLNGFAISWAALLALCVLIGGAGLHAKA